MTADDKFLIARALKEQLAWDGRAQGEVVMAINKGTLVCIISTIQLACRHPKFDGPTKVQVVAFVKQITDKVFSSDPATLEMIERGWNPVHDC